GGGGAAGTTLPPAPFVGPGPPPRRRGPAHEAREGVYLPVSVPGSARRSAVLAAIRTMNRSGQIHPLPGAGRGLGGWVRPSTHLLLALFARTRSCLTRRCWGTDARCRTWHRRPC